MRFLTEAKNVRLCLALSLLLAATCNSPALAQWTVTRVADQASTGIQIGISPSSISGQDIAFIGNNGAQLYKVTPASPTPVIIFQTGGPIPGSPGAGVNFAQIFETYSFDGQTFAFHGSAATPSQNGTYARTSAGDIALAGFGSSLPSADGASVAIDGDDVAFAGNNRIRVRRVGQPEQLISTATPVPGGTGNFTVLCCELDFDAGTVVFTATASSIVGIYYDRGDGTGIHKLVDTSDTAPGGTALFQAFQSNRGIAIDRDDVLFWAGVADGRVGLFLSRDFGLPQPVVVYDPAHPTFLPGGTERADRIYSFSLSNGEFALIARDDGNDVGALFASHGGVLERVIGSGDTLDGRTVDIPIGNSENTEMRSGDTLAFGVLFVQSPGFGGIYRADRGPAVANSGRIANGSFANGLNNWTTAGGAVAVVGGPAVQLTADPPGGPAGFASVSQLINTPNGSFKIIFDYRFTTTAGSLDVLINNTPVTPGSLPLPHPTSVPGTFSHVELVVNDPSLMGLAAANLVIRLNPGSFANAILTAIYSPTYGLPAREAQAEIAGNEESNTLALPPYAVVGTDSATAQNQAQVPPPIDYLLKAYANAQSPLFGGNLVRSLSDLRGLKGKVWSRARATNQYLVIYTGQGPVPSGPVPVSYDLNITGTLDNSDGAAEVKVQSTAYSRDIGSSAFFSGSAAGIGDGCQRKDDIAASEVVEDDANSVLASGDRCLVVVRRPISNLFYAPIGAIVAQEHAVETIGRSIIGFLFAYGAISDFSGTVEGALFSTVPGVGFVSVDADGDGDGRTTTADNCILVANADQRDTDGDGFGNACDADLNNNGMVNFADLALFRAAFGTSNANADLNGSGGVVNFGDLAIFRALFGKAPGPSGTLQ